MMGRRSSILAADMCLATPRMASFPSVRPSCSIFHSWYPLHHACAAVCPQALILPVFGMLGRHPVSIDRSPLLQKFCYVQEGHTCRCCQDSRSCSRESRQCRWWPLCCSSRPSSGTLSAGVAFARCDPGSSNHLVRFSPLISMR